MKIYWFKAQAPRRVLALVKYLGIKAELIEVDMMKGALTTPEYFALNPNKKAPVLVDGDFVLWESAAIMAHLCIKAGSDLWPTKNLTEQVEVLRWISWNDCHWAKVLGPFYFEHIVKSTFGIGPANIDTVKNAVPEFDKFAKVLDLHLAGQDYVACKRLTLADFQLAPMVSYWKESEMPLAKFSNIVHWLEVLNRIPAWAEPWPPSKYALK